MLENRDVSPEGAFNDSVQVIFTSHHFRTQPFTVNTIDRINLDRAMAIYKDRFADFSDFTFFFVGNIRIDSLKLLVEKYIAALPSLDRKETWRDVGVRVPQGVIHRELHRGIESKSRVSMTFSGPFEWTEQNRYVFASMINVLNIKLREVLREDLGGTYGVGVGGDASPFPRPEYQITIGWGCKPERVGEMEQAVLQQIDSLKLAPPDSIYIQKVSETQRRSYEIQKKTNSSWLWMLYNTYSRGKNPETILDYPRYIDSLTGKGVQEAAKKYFDMSNYITVELYPEK
jgi:zinc protease